MRSSRICEGLHNFSASQTTTSFSSIETNPCFGIYESITCIYCQLLIALSYVQLNLQIDLIDMRHLPDGEHHWILHSGLSLILPSLFYQNMQKL